jgi:hypothetical protein
MAVARNTAMGGRGALRRENGGRGKGRGGIVRRPFKQHDGGGGG